MNTYLKYKPVWVQFIAFGVLAFGLYALIGAISLFVITSVYNVGLQEIVNPVTTAAISAAKTAQTIISIGLFGVTALLFGYLSDPHPLRYLGFKKPSPPVFWTIGILLLAASIPAVVWLAELNQNMHFPKSLAALEKALRSADREKEMAFKKLIAMSSVKDLLINLIVFALIPSFVEELFFRGALQRMFIRVCKSPVAGIVITAIIFSAIHGQFAGFLPRILLGILLGALCWYSGSLWPGIIVHFINNAFQIFVYYRNPALFESNTNYFWWATLASVIVMGVIFYWMKRISQTRYEVVYDTCDQEIEFELEKENKE